MHLLTGMLIGELLLGGSALGRLKVKRPPFELVHVLPGRLRARVQSLVGEPELGAKLCALLASEEGIREARSDHRTGSVLLRFEESPALRERIIHVLRAVGEKPEEGSGDEGSPATPSPKPILRQRIQALARRADETTIARSRGLLDLRTLAGLGAAYLGVRALLGRESLVSLPGLRLLYWAYNFLKRG